MEIRAFSTFWVTMESKSSHLTPRTECITTASSSNSYSTVLSSMEEISVPSSPDSILAMSLLYRSLLILSEQRSGFRYLIRFHSLCTAERQSPGPLLPWKGKRRAALASRWEWASAQAWGLGSESPQPPALRSGRASRK